MLSKEIFIIFTIVFLHEANFGSAYNTWKNGIQKRYNEVEDKVRCVPEAKSCICICTASRKYYCKQCVVLKNEDAGTCNTPGEMIKFYCPYCACDDKGAHICEKCTKKYINLDETTVDDDDQIFRKKRDADYLYDYLYKEDPLPLSTEQRRQLFRQSLNQRRQNIIDKRRLDQELAEQQARLAEQNAEMQKQLEDQRQQDEQQFLLDAQQQQADKENYYDYKDLNDETEQQDEDADYFTKKVIFQ